MENMDYLKPLEDKISELLTGGRTHIVVAIDGHAASGKTTAGNYLAQKYDGNVIHMDDFFLPFEMRNKERMEEPGGNIHSERFHEEVWTPLSEGKEFCYRKFDCQTGGYGESRKIVPSAVTVVEGAYCMKPGLLKYDIGVFLDSDLNVQLKRVLERNGPEKLDAFRNRFIPMENKYFQVYEIENQADLSFDTSVIF